MYVTFYWKDSQAIKQQCYLWSFTPLWFLHSFDNFSILADENKKYLLEIKESLLIMRDKPALNSNINSAPLYIFDKVS